MFGVEYRCGVTGTPRLSLPCNQKQAELVESELRDEGFVCRIVFYPGRQAIQEALAKGKSLPSMFTARQFYADAV